MKPVTSQDTKWTIIQTTQGPKHQHAKLRGLGCLPTRSTQPERYSRSPGHHDLSVQIRRLKRSLMAKVWLPKLWPSTIPLIWTCGRLNSDKGARRYSLRNPCCTFSPKSEQIIFQGRFGDLIFVFKERNEYQSWREDNFVAHNLDTEFALFGVQTWEILRWQGRTAYQENLDEADFMETKFASLPRRISCKARWRTPKGTSRT
jgi:hypothetical protein